VLVNRADDISGDGADHVSCSSVERWPGAGEVLPPVFNPCRMQPGQSQ